MYKRQLRSLRPGEYWFSIAGIRQRVTLGEGEVRQKDIKLNGPMVSGKTLPSATVLATPRFKADYESITGYSDEHGEYQLRGLAPGLHTIKAASGPRGFTQRAAIEVEIRAVKEMKVNILQSEPTKREPAGSMTGQDSQQHAAWFAV